MEQRNNDRRRWLARTVKVMLLVALITALIPFCSGLAPRGKISYTRGAPYKALAVERELDLAGREKER